MKLSALHRSQPKARVTGKSPWRQTDEHQGKEGPHQTVGKDSTPYTWPAHTYNGTATGWASHQLK